MRALDCSLLAAAHHDPVQDDDLQNKERATYYMERTIEVTSHSLLTHFSLTICSQARNSELTVLNKEVRICLAHCWLGTIGW